MHVHTTNFFLVTFQDTVFFHCDDVEYAHGLVSGSASDEVAVWRPGERLDRIFVLVSANEYPQVRMDDRLICDVIELRTAMTDMSLCEGPRIL